MPSLDLESAQHGSKPSYAPLRLRSFLFVYVACALLFQLGGATPSWGPSSLLEAFCAGLFVMIAVVGASLARREAGLHRAFWLASCAALATLGVDEFFQLHESSGLAFLSRTDHLKVALWIGAGVALALVHGFERPSRSARLAMTIGYAMHTLYLTAEVGDGGYFTLPFGVEVVHLAEGVFELLMLSAYLFAFATIESETRELSTPEHTGTNESRPPLDRAA